MLWLQFAIIQYQRNHPLLRTPPVLSSGDHPPLWGTFPGLMSIFLKLLRNWGTQLNIISVLGNFKFYTFSLQFWGWGTCLHPSVPFWAKCTLSWSFFLFSWTLDLVKYLQEPLDLDKNQLRSWGWGTILHSGILLLGHRSFYKKYPGLLCCKVL